MDILPSPQRSGKQVTAQEQMCLRHLEAHPGVSWRDVAARYGWAGPTAVSICQRLLKKGRVTGTLEALEVADGQG
jgi:DNA-binding MarR family transcriptional regulator